MKNKIYLDAGHGGSDPGAVGNGMREADITFEVCTLLANILHNDFDIRLSRPNATTAHGINQRVQDANSWGADIFVSVHVNAGGGQGAETFYFRENSERSRQSNRLATIVNTVYTAQMGLRDRGVKPDTQTPIGSIGILRLTRMPAILPEVGFIDAPAGSRDIAVLRNERPQIAMSLAKGIYDFFGMEMDTVASDRFNKISELPDWARPTIQKLVDIGALRGEGIHGLDLSMDMIRTFVVHDRMGLYDRREAQFADLVFG